MFAETVATLSKADPMVIFRDLHKLYSQITAMKPDEVIAAYQTLDTCAQVTESEDNPVVMKVKDALREQMLHLCDRNHFTSLYKRFQPFLKK